MYTVHVMMLAYVLLIHISMPRLPGVSFACGMLFVLLIQLGGYSLLTLLSYLGLLQLVVCFVYINGSRAYLNFKGQGAPHGNGGCMQRCTYTCTALVHMFACTGGVMLIDMSLLHQIKWTTPNTSHSMHSKPMHIKHIKHSTPCYNVPRISSIVGIM